jgi:hypothetical protein
MCIRMCCHNVRTDATLNCSNIHDLAIRMESWDLTSLSWNLHRIFFDHLETLFCDEDSKINGIPDKMATLHNSDFVKQNAANTN